MDNTFNPDSHQSQPRPPEPTRSPNDLPEAQDRTTEQIHSLSKPDPHDKTTEQIHSLSNFNVSEALGLPVLTKDIGKPTAREGAREGGVSARGDRSESLFGYYSSQDRLMAAAICVIILGPLLLGAFRG